MSRKPSLFALKMQNLRSLETNASTNSKPDPNIFGERSCIITGHDAVSIHAENIEKLSNMTEEDIFKAQKELTQMMKQSHVEFIKSKKSKSRSGTGLESSIDKLSVSNSSTNLELELKDKGVHMDVVEPEKLKWMENVPVIQDVLPKSFYSARFDFEGDLMPYVDENKSTCDGGLYHHGDEPQRPGYTIDELYQLSRSSVTRQRIIALNTLAAILEKEYILADHLETPLLKQLVDSGIFLILRFSLDERLRTVYLAALRAISALFWRMLDMHYLSDMVGLFGDLRLPTFEIEDKELAEVKVNELKDVEVLKLNLIKGALRTDLVLRLRYICEDPLIEVDNLLSVIRCLTRICYDSDEATAAVLQTPRLLEILFANSQFPTNPEKMYVAKLMVLLRVIACRSREFAVELTRRLNLLPFLSSVIGDTVTKTATASQCIYLWHVLLAQQIGYESVTELAPVFYNLVNQLHSINAGYADDSVVAYASSLFNLLSFLLNAFYETFRFLIPTLERLCCQWINALIVEKTVSSRQFAKLVANSIYLFSLLQSKYCLNFTSFNEKVKNLMTTAYANISRDLVESSFILNANKRQYVECFPSLCVPISALAPRNGGVIVHALVKYGIHNGSNCGGSAFVYELFNDHLWTYVGKILRRESLNEIATLWSARYEIAFLCDLLKLCSKWEVFPDRKLLELAFVLVQIVHADDADLVVDLFNDVIFDAKTYERIMTSENDTLVTLLGDLNTIRLYFMKELNLSMDARPALLLTASKAGTQSLLPTDWHYVPILKISNNKEKQVAVSVQSIASVLKWIYLLEYFCEHVKINVSLAARYCRICCVFFCGDLFLDVADIMSAILQQILKRNDQLEFEGEIAGVSSFYDFYRELCEQYASSSYCNPVFGTYLLIPLQQKHDVRYRKYVWIEQPVIIRFLNFPVTRFLIPIDCFLRPSETDPQLIETYLGLVAGGRLNENISPVCYRIAIHHIGEFLRNLKDKTVAKILRERIHKVGNSTLLELLKNAGHE